MLEDIQLHSEYEPPPEKRMGPHLAESGSLQSLNLDNELYTTYAKAKNYLADLQFEDNVAPNHIAQVFNTISTILKEIVKMQTDLYNAERVKKLEAAMISAIKKAPLEAQVEFFEQYEKSLGS